MREENREASFEVQLHGNRDMAAALGAAALEVALPTRRRTAHPERSSGDAGLTRESIALYLQDIGKIPLLTKEQERQLGRQVQAGMAAGLLQQTLAPDDERHAELIAAVRAGEEAQDIFVLSNLRLGVSIAKRYVGRGLDLLDLIQESTFGLRRAVEKFDPEKKFKFSTYATWWVRQSIIRAIDDQGGNIRVPSHMQETLRSFDRQIDILSDDLDRPPTDEEICTFTGLSKVELQRLRRHRNATRTASLNMPLGDGGDELQDIIADRTDADFTDKVESKILVDALYAAIDALQLSNRDREILTRRSGLYGYKQIDSYKTIGRSMGLTQEGVRKIEQRLRRQLTEYMRGHGFRDEIAEPKPPTPRNRSTKVSR